MKNIITLFILSYSLTCYGQNKIQLRKEIPAYLKATPCLTTGSITGTLLVMSGNSTTLNCTPTGGVWSSSNVSVGTISTTGVFTGISAGNSAVKYSTGANCFSLTQVTVNPAITYATLNPSDKGAGTLSASNTTISGTTTGFARSTIGKTSGKYYIEYTITGGDPSFSEPGISAGSNSNTQYLGGNSLSFMYYPYDGTIYHGGAGTSGCSNYPGGGTIISMVIDCDNNLLYLFKSGIASCSAISISAITTAKYIAAGGETGTSTQWEVNINFGQNAFTYYSSILIGGSSLSALGIQQGFY